MIAALCSPVATRAISRASMMLATPMVMASVGTLSSPKKSAAASRRVTESSEKQLVRESETDLTRFHDARDAHGDGFGGHVVLAEEVSGGVAAGDRVERDAASPGIGA